MTRNSLYTKTDSSEDGSDDESGEELEDTNAQRNPPKFGDASDDTTKRRTVFVRSLPYTTTTESLSTHFSFIAPLKHATVVADPATQKSRGFGFVTFLDAGDAQNAVKQLNGSEFEGRKLRVEIAEKRHRETAMAAGDVKKGKTVDGADVKKRAPRLIIRNLAWSIKDPQELVKIFQSYGKVRNVIIPRKDNKSGGPMSGFAFVTMKGYRNAETAIEKTNGIAIGGRTVAVDWAVEKDEWEEKKPRELAAAEAKGKADEGGGVGMISDDDAESMDNASDASSDEGSDIGDFDDEDSDGDGDKPDHPEGDSLVVFIRNLPFSTSDGSLYEHFKSNFGPVRYARIVMDHATERPRGTGFVCFYNKESYDKCLSEAPRQQPLPSKGKSLLQNEGEDPTGNYTIDGRILQITQAVNKQEAAKLQEVGAAQRDRIQGDKRRLFLLAEGTIPASSPVFQRLSNSEKLLREASLKQRRKLLQSNPMLHLSLTRLSIRNLPRSVTAKDLKQLAREAVVGFAADVRAGRRQQLSKEEVARGGDEDREAERRRKLQGKGVVRQAKIVEEKAGTGRSRGYGFIEYSSHRWALMGLRWLNGHEVGGTGEPTERKEGKRAARGGKDKGKKADGSVPVVAEKKKRLVVEFAIENAQVVARRKEKEEKARERSKLVSEGKAKPLGTTKEKKQKYAAKDKTARKGGGGKGFSGGKRKREEKMSGAREEDANKKVKRDQETAKVSRIIARKRQIRRRTGKGGL